MMRQIVLWCVVGLTCLGHAYAAKADLWQADLADGTYQNPVLPLDYSDPDVVAVGDDFYLTASSFNAAPGLPILHSTDLVNWTLINYALPRQVPETRFAAPQHGNGVWAPNIRYHDNRYWIFYPDPDAGIYMIQASNPSSSWSKPKLILDGKGIIDPTPLWDDDGNAYLLHAWAKSRAGFNNVLSLHKMTPDGQSAEQDYTTIVDGNKIDGYRTLEGPKFYKRNGYYYIFAPVGGVDLGDQAVFRSKNIMGPYEHRTVMTQGNTAVNGPHQGAWIHTQAGEDWFMHFQARHAYGRIVHLQPMQWHNDWPVIGEDKDGNGIGQPVIRYKKPKTHEVSDIKYLSFDDEFNPKGLALAWQWNANPQPDWYSLTSRPGWLRLQSQLGTQDQTANLWTQPALLLQKLPAPVFNVTTKIDVRRMGKSSRSGLLLFGENYAWIGVKSDAQDQNAVVMVHCKNARKGCDESVVEQLPLQGNVLELRITLQRGASAVFAYKMNEQTDFKALGEHFMATKGRWVGAKIGLFSETTSVEQAGSVDVDYVRFTLPDGVTLPID
ncbi:glycoside hydrolase 43 family protein [Neptunicella marina]|uniref:Glycoside hydrolase 43 family protein n=1 Tax=Neptunicella marina TaxID=2125989 RepID=A0A8J6IUH1_9ALTE|nr:glycoside hydrolase 43 family protein [Neptunicella marina]MBC3766142.1 glycoside hydrolase 43 family protein [Neptunicella marina]